MKTLLLLPTLCYALLGLSATVLCLEDQFASESSEDYRFGDKIHKKSVYSQSSEAPIPKRMRNGRILKKVMVKTFKTTTTTQPAPAFDELSTTESTTIVNPYAFYANPYVSRRPSIPPKKYYKKVVSSSTSTTPYPTTFGRQLSRRIKSTTTTTTSTTTEAPGSTEAFTFPPFSPSSESVAVAEFGDESKVFHSNIIAKPSTTLTIPPKPEKKHYVKVTYTKAVTASPQTTEEPAPTTTTYPSNFDSSETTTPRPTPKVSTSPIRIITRTSGPIYTQSSEEVYDETTTDANPSGVDVDAGSVETTTQPESTTTPTSTESSKISTTAPKKVHYIITVIDPPKNASISSGKGTEVSKFVEELEESEEETTTTPNPDPYAHLQTLEFKSSSFDDNSPRYEFIPSVSNFGQTILFRQPFRQAQLPAPEPEFRPATNFRQQPAFRQALQIQLVPLRNAVSYQPSTLGQNSPFFTSKSVLYYTQVQPSNPPGPKFSSNPSPRPHPNALDVESFRSNFQKLPSLVSSTILQREPVTSQSQILGAVPAQSYYLNLSGGGGGESRRAQRELASSSSSEPELRDVPVIVDLVPL